MRKLIALFLVAVFSMLAIPSMGDPVKVTERTPVKLRILQEMTSGKSKVGEAVDYEVMSEIKAPGGEVLVARGAKAIGKVTVSKKRGILGREGKLEFTVEEMQAVDGSMIPLRAKIENSGKSNKGAVIASALVLTVLAIFVSGRDITVREGTEIVAYVDQDSFVDPAKNPENKVVAAPAPATPDVSKAEFDIISYILQGSTVIGEIQNSGTIPAGVEVSVVVRKDGKAVGFGSLVLDKLTVSEKRAYAVEIKGATEGEVEVSAKPKL